MVLIAGYKLNMNIMYILILSHNCSWLFQKYICIECSLMLHLGLFYFYIKDMVRFPYTNQIITYKYSKDHSALMVTLL